MNRCNSGTDGTVRMKEGAKSTFRMLFRPETSCSGRFFVRLRSDKEEKTMKTNVKTRNLTLMAMFAAMAYIVMAVARIPISSMDYLKYDPKDLVLAICGFTMGPLPALAVAVVVSLIEMVTLSSTGPIGLLMNILSSAMFVCTSAIIYKRRHSLRGAILGLIAGVAMQTLVMLLWNYFIVPLYMGMPREDVAKMLVPVFLPFNLIKGSINAALTILIYKPVSNALKRGGFTVAESSPAQGNGRSLGASLIAALVLASCIIAALVIRGVI